MDYFFIIAAVIAIVLIFLIIKVIKGIMKIFFYLLLIVVIISGVFSYFMFKDTTELASGISSKTSLFLLKDGNETITGFTIYQMNISTAKSLSENQLKEYDIYYQKKDYKKMLGSNYKLFIIDKKAFPKTDKFDPDIVIAYLKGDKKELELVNLIKPDYMPDTKAMAFSLLVIYSIKNDPAYLVKEYKSGNLIIYPETFMFKVVKFIAGGQKK